MGTWGAGSFQNDDAADLLYLFERNGAEALIDAFSATDVDYLEAPWAQQAIAAAEIVVLSTGKFGPLPENLKIALSRHAKAVVADAANLRAMALAALDRVEGEGSELKELWEEGGPEEWLGELRELRSRLSN